jgi:ElaB/YqjD/DUF883 family membrane-anchored ribosome-binding protein
MTRSSIHPEDADPTTAGDILDDLRAVVRDAEALLRQTEGEVGERVSEVRSRIEDKLEDARAKLHEVGAGKAESLRTAARSTDTYVRENPWTAIAIDAGVGFLIGAIGRRR